MLYYVVTGILFLWNSVQDIKRRTLSNIGLLIMAKDHRTGFEMGNIAAVMDGEIDGFINAYLSMNATK